MFTKFSEHKKKILNQPQVDCEGKVKDNQINLQMTEINSPGPQWTES